MSFPTTPGTRFNYRGETYYVIDARYGVVRAETVYGEVKRFYN